MTRHYNHAEFARAKDRRFHSNGILRVIFNRDKSINSCDSGAAAYDYIAISFH